MVSVRLNYRDAHELTIPTLLEKDWSCPQEPH